MIRKFQAEVISCERLTDRHAILRLKLPPRFITPEPGQFYLLRTTDTYDPLLRRPFSVFYFNETELAFLIHRKGRGTELLYNIESRSRVDVMGPLGRGYPIPRNHSSIIIVAGGMGVASVFYLTKRLKHIDCFIYGAGTASELVLKEMIQNEGLRAIFCTDDGSFGHKATVVEIFESVLQEYNSEDTIVYGCGPEGMIDSLKTLILNSGMKGYLSVEERMACGVGACMGCARKTSRSMVRVCRDGPVFRVEDL